MGLVEWVIVLGILAAAIYLVRRIVRRIFRRA